MDVSHSPGVPHVPNIGNINSVIINEQAIKPGNILNTLFLKYDVMLLEAMKLPVIKYPDIEKNTITANVPNFV